MTVNSNSRREIKAEREMGSLKAWLSQGGQKDLMEKMIFELNSKEKGRLSHSNRKVEL